MKDNLKSIVLGTIRHSDRHNVASVFTLERGRMAFLTPVGATKKGRASASRLMPLAIVEIQANISANRDLHIPSAVNQVRTWRNLYYDPHKAGVVMFLSEFLQRLLREAAPEPTLWRFIADSLTILDETTDTAAIANFHITFLISLMPLMGISPDISNFTEGMEFDMKGGTMVLPFSSLTAGSARVDARKSALLPLLARMNFANSRYFRFNGRQRSELLDMLLKYYGCHFPGCDNLKSLDVMREIFS